MCRCRYKWKGQDDAGHVYKRVKRQQMVIDNSEVQTSILPVREGGSECGGRELSLNITVEIKFGVFSTPSFVYLKASRLTLERSHA